MAVVSQLLLIAGCRLAKGQHKQLQPTAACLTGMSCHVVDDSQDSSRAENVCYE